MTSGLPPEIEARQQLITGLLQWLHSLDSGVEWAERVLTLLPVPGGPVRGAIVERRPDGGEQSDVTDLPDSVGDAVRSLQQYMYTPTGGAWLSAELSVTAQGQADARFEFDEQPTVPRADGSTGLTPAEVAAHLQTFPRPSDATPAWMRPSS